MANHECHVRLVLEKFLEVHIYAELEKCGFHQFEVEFLGCIISRDGICMDPCKVQTIVNGLPQLLFGMFNVFLGSLISIDNSLYIISR
jgi:hypothetical protein